MPEPLLYKLIKLCTLMVEGAHVQQNNGQLLQQRSKSLGKCHYLIAPLV